MNNLEPSQLFEIILSQQNNFSRYEVPLSVRTFNKIIDELTNLNLRVRFGYSDFLEFIDTYHKYINYKEHILHIFYSEDLLRQVRQYNRIYENIDKLTKSNDLWQNYLK